MIKEKRSIQVDKEPTVLSGTLRPPSETVPVARQVWRNICKVGCGWLRYRVTMMKDIRWLWFISIYQTVQIRCCKYCDKQITPIDRVSMCLAIGQVSCDKGIVPNLVLLANGLIRKNWIIHSHHLQTKYKWVDKASFRIKTSFPFAFGHVWIAGSVALRWHISEGNHGN